MSPRLLMSVSPMTTLPTNVPVAYVAPLVVSTTVEVTRARSPSRTNARNRSWSLRDDRATSFPGRTAPPAGARSLGRAPQAAVGATVPVSSGDEVLGLSGRGAAVDPDRSRDEKPDYSSHDRSRLQRPRRRRGDNRCPGDSRGGARQADARVAERTATLMTLPPLATPPRSTLWCGTCANGSAPAATLGAIPRSPRMRSTRCGGGFS